MSAVTWQDVVKYIDDAYTIGKSGDMIELTFVYPSAEIRKQVVLVDHVDQPDGLIVEVLSCVGEILPDDLPEVLKEIGKKPPVALTMIDNLYYVKVMLDMNYVPMSDIGKIVNLVSRTADFLEKKYCDGDLN